MTTLTMSREIYTKFDLIIELFVSAASKISFSKTYMDMVLDERISVDNQFMKLLIKDKIKINKDELELFKSEYPDSFIIPTLSNYTDSNSDAHLSEIDIATNAINERAGQKVTILKFSEFGFPITIH